MTFFQAIEVCFKKYVDFEGRAERREFWWFFLFQAIVNAIAVCIPFIGWLISLAVLLPTLAVTVRRLRDVGKHWANVFWYLLPIVGIVILIIYCIRPSIEQQNA